MIKILNVTLTLSSCISVILSNPPTYVLKAMLILSLVSAWLYTRDKRIAIKNASGGNRRRVPETRLIMLSLLGGGAGSLLGQLMNRHKTSNSKFIATHIVSSLLFSITIVYFYTPSDSALRIPLNFIQNVLNSL
ncbi:DUF1294 domain-containing protein [Vibrio sp. 10N.239.312.D08]|uniref:DUF1294 domain-containing protein n=1 Tax=Vibrio sp. 10N.239.312.D08 TaxID=3229978 RepID=UPI00354BB368